MISSSSSQTNNAEVCCERTYLLYDIQLPLEMVPNGIRDFILARFSATVRVGGYAQRTYTEVEKQCVRLVLRSTSPATLDRVQGSLVKHEHWTYRLISQELVSRPHDDLNNFQILPSDSENVERGAKSRDSKDYQPRGGSQKGGVVLPHITQIIRSRDSSQKNSVKSSKIGSSSHGGSTAAAAERRVDAAQERVDVAKNDLRDAQKRVDAAQTRVDAALDDVHKAQQGFAASTASLSAARDELEQARQNQSCAVELKRLESECKKRQVSHSSAKLLLSHTKESLSQAKNSLAREERGLESALKYLETTQQLFAAMTFKSIGLQPSHPSIF